MNSLLKIVNTVVIMAVVTLSVSPDSASAVSKVAGGKHDFSIGGGSFYQATAISQVCIFCHTPHNAGQARLLWNKASNNAATSFRLYTSSGTLTNVVKQNSSLPAGSPSLLCLSCHDGKTALNVLHSSSTGVDASGAGYPAGSKFIQTSAGFNQVLMPGPLFDMGSGSFGPSMNLGRASDGSNDTLGYNLTDDHPIGFSYSAVLADASETGLHTLNDAKTSGMRFFGSSNRVECSTCHDPHVDYSAAGDPDLKPFLVRSNTGSGLCLACHNK